MYNFFSQAGHDWMLPGATGDLQQQQQQSVNLTPPPSTAARYSYADNSYMSMVAMETNSNSSTYSAMTGGCLSAPMQTDMAGSSGFGKRKSQDMLSPTDGNEDDEDDEPDNMKKFARQNHSEIEKRRRDKMNTYILQLSKMLPMCNAMNRKCDKLTVLRMAVQHMKSLRGASTSTEALHKPSFLSDDELKHTILEAADGFLFVVGCDRARILFVSESVTNILQYTRNELIGQSLFDFIHPRDIPKVKEQFSSSDLAPRERLIDAKTLMPVKTELPQRPTHLCSGARRSFYCRMKYRSSDQSESGKGIKYEKEDMEFVHRKRKSDQKSYTVIHFTGYLKSWPTSTINISNDDDLEDSSNVLSCLVAIGQNRSASNHNPAHSSSSKMLNLGHGTSLSGMQDLRNMDYMFRISMDGKLTFIDQATTIVLGYLPQELLGTSVYEYYHQDDLTKMAEIHRKVLDSKEKISTGVYRFKAKNGSFVPVKSTCFSFRNPWTRELEYIVSTNSVVPIEEVTSSCQGYESVLSLDSDCSATDCSIGEKIGGQSQQEKFFIPGLPGGTRPGAGRIGRQIADEVLETSRQSRSPQVVDSTNTDILDSQLPGKLLSGTMSSKSTGENPNLNASRTAASAHKGPNGISAMDESSRNHHQNSLLDSMLEEQVVDTVSDVGVTDDGDEAAMSLIMSLLEADAGLGGPIDFNDLPWPL